MLMAMVTMKVRMRGIGADPSSLGNNDPRAQVRGTGTRESDRLVVPAGTEEKGRGIYVWPPYVGAFDSCQISINRAPLVFFSGPLGSARPSRRATRTMASLNSSEEWRILQGIGCGIANRLARFKAASPTNLLAELRKRDPDVPHNNNVAFLETELRELLGWQPNSNHDVPPVTLKELRQNFAKLCATLERAVNPAIVPSKGDDSNQRLDLYSQRYPKLLTLHDFLTAGAANEIRYDLVCGPNHRLFTIGTASEAKEALDAACRCNELLLRACDDNASQFRLATIANVGAEAEATSMAWARPGQVLEALFRQFSGCSPDHEILLHLPQNEAQQSPTRQTLDMFLRCRSEAASWIEAQCLEYE